MTFLIKKINLLTFYHYFLFPISVFYAFFNREPKAILIDFESLKLISFISTPSIIFLLFLEFFFGRVEFRFKIPLLQTLSIALFMVIVEEFIFRNLLLHALNKFMEPISYHSILSLSLVSGFFGLAHYRKGRSYVYLSMIAGFFFGGLFLLTSQVEVCIIAHFTLNTMRYTFFAKTRKTDYKLSS